MKKIILLLFLVTVVNVFAQEKKILDEIVAVIGDEIVLQSDIEQQYMQMKAQGILISQQEMSCNIFEEFLVQKLLLNQAELDSIVVSESQVEIQLDQRLNYFIERIGSKEMLEQYFNKTIYDIKRDMRIMIREQLTTQKMQSEITGKVTITPSEVRAFYHKLPKDSIPFIESKMEYNQLVKKPKLNENAEFEAKEKLLAIRKRITDGEKFSTLAVLYSEDPGSAAKGGEIGFLSKAELAPEYAEIAFKLKEGQISNIVKTDFGYHIIQMIEKKENRVNTRHILVRSKYSPEAIQKIKVQLDSILTAIRLEDTVSFEKTAKLFSDDDDSRRNGGLVINPETNTSTFTTQELKQMYPYDFYMIKNLKVGEISEPFMSSDKNGKEIYKIIRLKSISEPHVANMELDYNLIRRMAEEEKKQRILEEWVNNKIKTTYIQLGTTYKECKFNFNGWMK